MSAITHSRLPADLENPCLKLTAVSMTFQGRVYQWFVMTKDGRTITHEQACQICPPWGQERYRVTTG